MSRWFALLFASLTACTGSAKRPHIPEKPVETDPDGPHRAAVAAQVQPFLDGEIIDGVVIGLYDQGKTEIYGFGKGPGGAKPTGKTLYEIGSVTKVYTSLLLADSVQRREVTMDTAVAELLPPGVIVPSKDKQPITLKHLALHASGLPRLPPSLMQDQKPDPYGGYGEDQLYKDLIATELQDDPGTRIVYSNYGAGLLGFALGKKLGGGYSAILKDRILGPLGLHDTTFGFPPGSDARRAQGTNDDGKPVIPWTFEDALAGAGALVSDVHDQLALIDAELDAAAGGKVGPLRGAMRFTQEEQLESAGANSGLGWQIDAGGRYWHNGGTGGFHTFVSFDTKTKRGIVVLASTSTMLVDRLAERLYDVIDGTPKTPQVFPAPDALVPFAGTYDFQGNQLEVTVDGKRLYIKGPGEPRQRLLPLSDHEFFLEEIQAPVVFQKADGQVGSVVFVIGGKMFNATRVK